MPNTLYVVGVPAGSPRDLTLRSRRILAEVQNVAACEPSWARHFLARLNLRPAVLSASAQAEVWAALERSDLALLSRQEGPGLCSAGIALLEAAVERGIPVTPVPGPALALTALVVSGLPADSFVFLGKLPEDMAARRRLLDPIASERRTLIVIEAPDRLADCLTDLNSTIGDRPLVVVVGVEPQPGWIWRGTLAAAVGQGVPGLVPGPRALVIGGATIEEPAWDEQRLRVEVEALLGAGLRPGEIGRQLSDKSGWSRREIYRLAVEQSHALGRDRAQS